MRAVLLAGLLLLSACGLHAADVEDEAPPLAAALETLAAQGNGEAYYHLGMLYHLGQGLPQDKAKALAVFRQAADLGDPLGAYKLGCYYDGHGEGLVQDDADLALQYKLVAAEQGYALAQQDVGILYGAKGDFGTALGWLARAAAQGWPDALRTYASVNNGAAGIPKNAAVTAVYFSLYLRQVGGTDTQQKWLADFEAKLSPVDKESADQLVADYKPGPTPLTIKGLAGQRSAEPLVAAASQ